MSGRYVGFVLIAVIILGAAGIVFRLISTESATIKLFGDVSTLNSETVDKIVMRDAEQQTIVEKLDRQWWVGKYPALNIRMETLWETVSRIVFLYQQRKVLKFKKVVFFDIPMENIAKTNGKP